MKNRDIKEHLKRKADSKFGRIIALTGARQTGKTTLLKHEFKEYKYISFDDPVIRPQYLAYSAQQWYQQYPEAILDEVQKAPRIIDSIKAVHDAYDDSRYIISGSSQILLLKNVSETLAGRISIFELYPLTLPEMKTGSWSNEIKASRFLEWLSGGCSDNEIFNGIPLSDPGYCSSLPLFENYLQYGGMPALSSGNISPDEKDEWLRDYIKTYLQRDVRDLGNIRELEPFVIAQKIAAGLTGQMVNYNAIAKAAGISPKTAMKFITYLSMSYQVILLQPWFRNEKKRLSKSAKLHFLDPGIQRRLLSRKGEITGNEFESAVVAELFKQIKAHRLDLEFFHLRTVDGREIDLLIETEEGFVPIEIKKSYKVTANDARHIKGIEQILDKPVIHSFILSQDPEIKQFDKNITCLPAVWALGPMD